MGNKLVLGLIVIAAVVGVVFLLGGAELFTGSSGGDGDGGAGAGAGLSELDGAGEGAGDGEEDAAKGPLLFGRARSDRQGKGGLHGRVMDFQSGKPVAEAQVTLAGKGYGGEALAVRGSTDASGYFAFRSVAAGDGYALHVSDSKSRARTLPSQSIDRGGHTDVGTVWLGKRGTLKGTVVDEAGEPISDADVQVHPGGTNMLELLSNMGKMLEELDKDAEPLASGKTDASGRFSIDNLAPGPLTLVVRASGHEQATQAIMMAHEGAAGGDVVVRMATTDVLTGIVVDQSGRPIGGARLACFDKNEMQSVFYGRQFTETDASGRFTIGSPPSGGSFAVIVTATGYPTLFTEAKERGEQRFVLHGGTEVLMRVVEAGTRRGVEGAHLMAMFTDEKGSMSSDGMNFAAGVTDARGEATFVARPGKLMMLYFNHPERGTGVFSPMLASMGAAAKGLLEGPKDTTIGKRSTTLEFQLGTGVTVTGHVTDDQGKPIEGARCAVMGTMGFGSAALSDAEGYYELKNQSLPLRFVMASKQGYVQELGLAGLAGARVSKDGVIDVKLIRAASVTGRVVTATGKPVAGVRVRAASDDALAMLSAMSGGSPESITNAEGMYVLDGAQPGKKVRVKARHVQFVDGQTPEFEVTAAGATQAPDLVVKQGAVLTITVEGPDGRVVRGARVEVDVEATEDVEFDALGGFRSFADVRTRAGGKVEVPKVPVGEITITARFEDNAPGRVKVKISGEESAKGQEVLVSLRRGLIVKGRVVGDGGAALKGALVRVEAAREGGKDTDEDWVPMDNATTGKDGSFELKGLPGVQVKLVVSMEGHLAVEQLVTPGLGDVTVELKKQDGDVAARLKAIDEELMGIYGKFGEVKDEAERKALAEQMQALQAEKAKLKGDG